MYNQKNRFGFSFLLLVLLILLLPLSVSKYFASHSDLPKSSLLIALGGLFVVSVIISYLIYFRRNYNELILNLKAIDIAVILFTVSLILSAVLSVNPEISYHGTYHRQTGLKIFLYCILIYFAVSAVLSQGRMSRLIFFMEVTAVTVSLYSVLQWLSSDPFSIQPENQIRPVSTLGSPVFLGGFLILILPFSVLNISGKKNVILTYLFPTVISAGIVLSGTRSSYIAVAAQLMCALFLVFLNRQWLKPRLKRYMLISLAGISVVTIIVLALWGDFYYNRIILSGISDNPRLVLWRDSLPVFLKYPFTGCGIAAFPQVFEDFCSYELRLTESSRYFDHPHNNFLYYLYSCGIIGFVSYVLMLISVLGYSVKKFIQRVNSDFYFATTLFVTGYMIYGFTNFDDITIILYLFVLLGLFRFKHDITLLQLRGRIILIILSVVILYSYFSNLYTVYNDLKSDRYYKLALTDMKENKFKDATDNLNTAINLSPRNAVYRYELASYSYLIAQKVYGEDRSYLLEQIKAEIERARKNYISNLECDELLTMVYFEEGNISAADSMKLVILTRDPVNINYRIHLTGYYLRNNNLNEAKKQLEMIFKYSPENTEACYLAVRYYDLVGDTENLNKYCSMILIKNPDDLYVREVLKKYSDGNNRR